MSVADGTTRAGGGEVQRGPVCVGDLMTKGVATFHKGDELVLADDLMQLGRIRHIPIVAADGRAVIGRLSQRDLFRCALARALGIGDHGRQPAEKTVAIGDIMTTDVKTVTPDSTLASAAKIMSQEKIGCLPVVDAEDKGLVGIITESDLVRYLGER